MNASTAQVLLFEIPEELDMNPGQKLAQVWKGYKETMTTHQKALADLQSTEKSLFPGMEDYRYSIESISERNLEEILYKTANDIRQRLSWMASRHFAPAEGRLEIDDDKLKESFPVDRYSDLAVIEAFDPAAVWAWLETHYGGDAGKTLAYRQLAGRIKSALWLDREEEIVLKAGYVVLSRSAWTESYSSGPQYSHSTYQMIQKALICLGEVADWMGRHQLSRDVSGHANSTRHFDKMISREKFGFGEQGAEILMVTFKSSVEFRLRADFAEQLQIFLGTYRTNEE